MYESPSFGDTAVEISTSLSNIMKPDALCLWSSKRTKTTFEKNYQQCPFPEIMTWLLRIDHGPCCENFHVETASILPEGTAL